MKKIIVWLLVLAITASVSIGTTLAFLTDTDEDVNVMTLGKVEIEQLEYERVDTEAENSEAVVEEFENYKPLYPSITDKDFDWSPGDSVVDWEQIGKKDHASEIWDPEKINNEQDKMVFVKNTGDYDAYVRSVFAFEAAPGWTWEDFERLIHLNLNDDTWDWEWVKTPVTIGSSTYILATATYKDILSPGTLTDISLSQVALDKLATNADVAALGDTYQILVMSQGIQADGFTDPKVALEEGFGTVTADEQPFADDQLEEGVPLKQALHYLNGGDTQITDQVTNVVFGKAADYPQITSAYAGTLTDVEQNRDAFAYYVPQDSGHSVYVLSEDTVYTPRDSTGLFQGMSALTQVDTANLDVSRTEIMDAMFRDCTNLAEVDVSNWDTSKVTSTRNMFRFCENLLTLDVSNWDTSNIEDMYAMFYLHSSDSGKTKLNGLDVSGWDTSKVTDMTALFYGCTSLENLELGGWDVSNVTSMWRMFSNCKVLGTIDIGAWDVSSCTTLKDMFVNCESIPSLDLSRWDVSNVTNLQGTFTSLVSCTELNLTGWDTSNVTTMCQTFWNCPRLTGIPGLGGFDTSKVTNMQGMFGYMGTKSDSLTLDVSNFDTSNVTNMQFMFCGCINLMEVDVSGWDTSNVTTIKCMFQSNGSNNGRMMLQSLDVSNWDTSKVTDMNRVFYGCGHLTELDLTAWDVSNVTNMDHMFTDCYRLEKIDMTGWDTSNVTCMDAMFNNNDSAKVIDVSSFDTSNNLYFSQMFEYCYSLERVIGLENFDTSKSIDFSEMFYKCYKLKEADLSSFDTSNAQQVYRMFTDCTELEAIYVSDRWDMSHLSGSGMFQNCYKLVGGAGTVYNSKETTVSYARIDSTALPGYLTYKEAPAEE